MDETTSRRRSFLSRIPRIRFRLGDSTSSEQSAAATYYLILVPALLLASFGLLMGFSATAVANISAGVNPYVPFLRTVAIALVALGLAFLSSRARPGFWDQQAATLYIVSLVLQLLVIPFGIGAGGNVNWLPIPGTGQAIQPSEFLKLTTALILGRTLSQPQVDLNNWRHVAVAAGIPSVLSMITVMAGADMGTMLIFVGIAIGAIWVAGVPGRWFLILFSVGGATMVFLVTISSSRIRRVIEFLPGFRAPPSTSAPTQTDHGLWALGSGGLTGLGPGASREKWNYLQEAHTDFILAIVGEEFGLIGTLSMLVLFGLLVYGVLRLAANATTRFVRVSSAAIAAWFIVQGLINVGTVTGLTPVIGVPFPLVSYGGSAFLFTALAIGVLLSFARAEAGFAGRGKLDPDTGGRDPRRKPRRRKPQ